MELGSWGIEVSRWVSSTPCCTLRAPMTAKRSDGGAKPGNRSRAWAACLAEVSTKAEVKRSRTNDTVMEKCVVLPEFAWMGEKTAGLARASCSTKEHIRVINGSILVEKAANLHAGPRQAEMAEIRGGSECSLFHSSPWPGKVKAEKRWS